MLPVAHVPLIVRLIGQLERGRGRRRHAGARVPARAVRRGLPRRPLRRGRARLRHRARAARHGRGDPLRRRPRRHRRHVRRRQRRRAHRPRRSPTSSPPTGPPAPRRRSTSSPSRTRRRSGSSSWTTTGRILRFVEKPAAGHRAEQPDQRRHVRVRAERARPHPDRSAGVDRARDVPAGRRRRSASTRWRPTTTGSTPGGPSCTCRPTSTCQRAARPARGASRARRSRPAPPSHADASVVGSIVGRRRHASAGAPRSADRCCCRAP